MGCLELEMNPSIRCPHCGIVQFIKPGRGNCVRCHDDLNPKQEDHSPPEIELESTDEPLRGIHGGIPATIKRLRKEHKMSQYRLAIKMKSPRPYISKVELGVILPAIDSVQRFATAFGLSMADLVWECEVSHPKLRKELSADPFVSQIISEINRLDASQKQSILHLAKDLAKVHEIM